MPAGITESLALDARWDHQFAGWKRRALLVDLIAPPTIRLQIHHPAGKIRFIIRNFAYKIIHTFNK
jgi:hypothetical protein